VAKPRSAAPVSLAGEVGASPLEAEAEEALDAIEETLAGIPAATQIKVRFYRLGSMNPEKGGLDQEYLFTVPYVPGMDVEEVARDRAGGGKIQVTFRYPPGMTDPLTGRASRTVTFLVAGTPKDPTKEAAKVPPAEAVPVGVLGSETVTQLRIELARTQGLVEGMRAGQGQAQAVDPMAMIEKLSTTMKNLQGPLPVPPDPMGSIDKIVSAVEKIVGVGREIAPESPSTDWGKVVDRSVGAVEKLIEENRLIQGRPPVTDGIQQADNVLLATAAAGVGNAGMPGWQQEILSWVPRLLGRAQADKDPGVAADVFVEDISGATRATLRGMVGQPTFVTATLAQLAQIEPKTAELRPWFTDFVAAVQEALAVEAEAEVVPEGPVTAPAAPNGDAPVS
jgi:hypothetical protein